MTREERLALDKVVGEPILFYGPKNQWGVFSNFSKHAVLMRSPWTGKEVRYPTTEHRYQAMKANNQLEHDWVAASSGPGMSKTRGRQVSLWENWGAHEESFAYLVMLEAVMTKARAHSDVMRQLYATGTTVMYEDSPTDDIWGWRYQNDYRGLNLLGKAWMQARALLL